MKSRGKRETIISGEVSQLLTRRVSAGLRTPYR